MQDPAAVAVQYNKMPKSALNEYFQVHGGALQFTTMQSNQFNPIQPDFVCTLNIPSVATADGTQSQMQFTAHSRTKKSAEHAAAEAALNYLASIGAIPSKGASGAQAQPQTQWPLTPSSQPFVSSAAAPAVHASAPQQAMQVASPQQSAQSPAEALSQEELAEVSAWIDGLEPDEIKRLLMEVDAAVVHILSAAACQRERELLHERSAEQAMGSACRRGNVFDI